MEIVALGYVVGRQGGGVGDRLQNRAVGLIDLSGCYLCVPVLVAVGNLLADFKRRLLDVV